MNLLKDKIAIITGGTRGIGKSIAIEFAKQGAHVAFTYRQTNNNAQTIKEELLSYGIKAKGYAADASKFDETTKVVEEILKDFGTVDILVNNAGITEDTLLMRMTESQWDTVINVNLKSVFNFTKAIQYSMLKQRSGSIINISSIVGIAGNAGQTNYSASKAGILGFTKSVAKELGGRNIRCNAIAPGFIATEMTEQLPEEVKADWNKRIPLKRQGTSEEVAKVAVFLASDLSAYITKEVISVTGGMDS